MGDLLLGGVVDAQGRLRHGLQTLRRDFPAADIADAVRAPGEFVQGVLDVGELLLQVALQREVALLLVELGACLGFVVAVARLLGVVLHARLHVVVRDVVDLDAQAVAITFEAPAQLVELSLIQSCHTLVLLTLGST